MAAAWSTDLTMLIVFVGIVSGKKNDNYVFGGDGCKTGQKGERLNCHTTQSYLYRDVEV